MIGIIYLLIAFLLFLIYNEISMSNGNDVLIVLNIMLFFNNNNNIDKEDELLGVICFVSKSVECK